MPIRCGYIHGTGAAINVEIGFVPDYVRISNLTDGDLVTEGFLKRIIVFTGGGTTQIKNGEWLKGVTSGAKARIQEVILDDVGSWSAGTAAGFFICDPEEVTGTIVSENMQRYATEPGSAAATTDSVTVVVDVEFGLAIAAAVAGESTLAAQVIAYIGTEAVRRKGFTLGSTLSETRRLMFYLAIANDPGMDQSALVLGNDQQTDWKIT